MADDNQERAGIEVEGLVREFKNGPRAVDGIDLHVAPGRDLRLPRPQRGRQVDHGADADHAAAAHRGDRAGRRLRHRRAKARRVRGAIGAALQEAALDPLLTGREHMRLQTALHGLPKAERGERGDELLEPGRPLRGGRPQGRRLLGRDEAAARPGAGARPPAAHPLPRRADHRPRHPEPHRALGRGRAARRRGGRHGLPHHAVPGGGRRARRPGRDHRPWPDRRRGHAGRAEGRDRPADGRGGPARPGRPGAGGARRCSRSASGAARRTAAAPRCCSRAARRSSPTSCARSTPRGSRSSSCSCTRPRSTTSSSPRPAARWRAPGDEESEAGSEEMEAVRA